MGQLLVRNVDDGVIERLRRRAAEQGCSVEAAHREILRAALDVDEARRKRELEALKADLRRLRDETAGRGGPTGTELIREDRDNR